MMGNALPTGSNDFNLPETVIRIESWLKRLCALSLILLMQGPAMLVQEVAWAKMLVSYTQQRGLIQGVVETFDGKHPCKMCVKAAELREGKDKDNPFNRSEEKHPIRFTWGEMVATHHLMVPNDFGTDCRTPLAAGTRDAPGRDKDSPVVPPPERA